MWTLINLMQYYAVFFLTTYQTLSAGNSHDGTSPVVSGIDFVCRQIQISIFCIYAPISMVLIRVQIEVPVCQYTH